MKKNFLIIIGAGGHGRVVSDIAKLNGYEKIAFLDDNANSNCICNVIGKIDDYVEYINDADFFVAIGNSKVRSELFYRIKEGKGNIVSLIHPAATISDSVSIGQGVVVMAGAVVNNSAVIKDGVIINTCSSVDHDCVLGEFVHVAVGANVAGTVKIGGHSWIGAGATIINNINICDNCMIGAGTVAIKNIEESGTYVGSPARKVK